MPYNSTIEHIRDFSATRIIDICKSELPDQWKRLYFRHPSLRNGIALLDSDEAMNAYYASYGEMHIAKCRAAFQNFPYENINGSIEIIDWACGQGIGTLCAIEALKEHDMIQWLRNITLIEPAERPLERAVLNCMKATGGNVNITPLNQYLPGDGTMDEIEGFTYRNSNVIHIFSNILDIRQVNIEKLSRIVATVGRTHYVMCIGPMNSNAYRIDQFASIFGNQSYFSNISDYHYSHTTDTFKEFTCKTKCFQYDGSPISVANIDYSLRPAEVNGTPIDNDYDIRMAVLGGSLTEAETKLYELVCNSITDEDILLVKPDINGDKPTFVIVQPDRGIILIDTFKEELSDYEFYTYSNGDKPKTDYNRFVNVDDEENVICTPVNTLVTYHNNLINLHIEGLIDRVIEDRRNYGLITKMLVCLHDSTEDTRDKFKGHSSYVVLFGKDVLSDEQNKADFQKIIRNAKKNDAFDRQTFKSFMRIFTPKWHSYREGAHYTLTTAQRHLVVSRPNATQKISGVAGSGKTQVLVNRAANAQVRTGGRILILTYNVTLANYIRFRMGEVRADFRWDKIDINYYHRFFRAKANLHRLHVGFNSYQDENFFERYRDHIEKYDSIFIDEVQDYDGSWLRILYKYFLKEDGELAVFGDPKQNIFNKPKGANGDMLIGGVIPGVWNHELDRSMRFVNQQLTELINKFKDEFINKNDGFAGNDQLRQRTIPMSVRYANINRAETMGNITVIARYCREICRRFGVEDKDVVVLSQAGDIMRDLEYQYRNATGNKTSTTFIPYEAYQTLLQRHGIENPHYAMADYAFKQDKEAADHNRKENFTMSAEGMKFSTIHSFKGWEAKTVIMLIEPLRRYQGDTSYCIDTNLNSPELIYTALTRARENLFIFNLGNTQYDNFFSRYINN